MLPTQGMKTSIVGDALCSECGGLFPSQEALAQHLLDHNRLRVLDDAVPVAVPVAAMSTPQAEHAAVSPPAFPAESSRPPPVSTPSELEKGLVKLYNADERFGFITRGDGSEDVFFHVNDCDVQTPEVSVGEIVRFEDEQGPRGRRAARVIRNNPGGGNHGRPSASPRTPTRKSSPRDFEKLLRAKQRALAELPQKFGGGKYPRFVYVDLDNIWTSFMKARHILSSFEGAETTRDLLFDLDGLTLRLSSGGASSSVDRLVAFYFNTPETIARALRKRRYLPDGVTWDVRKQETASDTSMQLELLKDKRPCGSYPKTLVLVTGDGNIAPNGMGFRDVVDLYLRDGWFIEVHAWLSTTAQSYIEFQRQYPSQVVIRPFDDGRVVELVRIRDHASNKTPTMTDEASELKVPTPHSTTDEDEEDTIDSLQNSTSSNFAHCGDSLKDEIEQAKPSPPIQSSQSERVIALAQTMTSATGGIEPSVAPQIALLEAEISTAEAKLRAKLFETAAHLLESANDSSMYVPSALAILGITRPDEAMILQEADTVSQLALLRLSLQRELDYMHDSN